MTRLTLIFLLWGLLVGKALAAENNPQAVDDSGNNPELADSGDAEPELEAAVDSDEAGAEDEESSARFIPTEQISQDLGVSFPIDI